MRINQKQWNVLGFLAGDNNLAGAAIDDIREMETVGSTGDFDVLVQVDHAADYVSGKDDFRSTRRYHVKKSSDPRKISSELLVDLGKTNTGDPAVLRDFIDSSVNAYPAERTMLVLWNHGSGFYVPEEMMSRLASPSAPTSREINMKAAPKMKRTFFSSTKEQILSLPPAVRGICYDDGAQDCLDNKELKDILRFTSERLGGRKLDVLGMDACLMTMIEVAYQVKDHVEVLVGSEETEPGAGWPYDAILRDLAARPAMTAKELGAAIVKRYVESYGGSGENVTQAALDLSRLGDLTGAMDTLAKTLLDKLSHSASLEDKVWSARRKTKSFYDGLYVDIHDLAGNISSKVDDAAVRKACQGVMRAVEGVGVQTPILAESHLGAKVSRVKGLSVYWPVQAVPSAYYGDLDFAKATRWHDLLKAFVGDDV